MTTHQYPAHGHGHYQPPATPPPAKKGRVHWAWLIGTFVLGLIFGNLGDPSSGPVPTASAPTQAAQAPAALQPVPQAERETQAPAEPDLTQGIGDGQWSVPDQVAPGKYRSTGAKPGIFDVCSATTRSESGNVIDWKTGNEGEQVQITVGENASEFSVTGCEPFVKVG